MLFNSLEFLGFFVVVFGVYWALPWKRARVWLLLVASYAFYMSWNAKLAAVICASSAIDYVLGRSLEASPSARVRKLLLTGSIAMNLGLLFYFKYANFFLESLSQLLSRFGIHAGFPLLAVLLPIGISFYTFEAISYVVDVSLRRVRAERRLDNFLLFIAFFPRMVAGPIIRARNFLPQVDRHKPFDWARIHLGSQYVLAGLFKKVVLADRMAFLVDPIFARPDLYCSSTMWIAVIAYAVQLYCDFSGYSDIAIGTAHMLGYKLPQNFDRPYFSTSTSELWRRWHISLSTWLRDYVYIPLGGNRGTRPRVAMTLLLTMALCGLWHGANWTYVVFGLWQGLMMLADRRVKALRERFAALDVLLSSRGGSALRIITTFLLFSLSLVVFRATTLDHAGEVFSGLFSPQAGLRLKFPITPWSLVFALAVIGPGSTLLRSSVWKKAQTSLPAPALGLVYAAALILMVTLAAPAGKPFIYFQF